MPLVDLIEICALIELIVFTSLGSCSFIVGQALGVDFVLDSLAGNKVAPRESWASLKVHAR